MKFVKIEGLDLDVSDADEPRVRDIDLAEFAGMKVPRKIRTLIKRNRAELECFGPFAQRRSEQQIEKVVGKRQLPAVELREVNEYYLNEAQALTLAAKMRTPGAAQLRAVLVRLFLGKPGERPRECSLFSLLGGAQ